MTCMLIFLVINAWAGVSNDQVTIETLVSSLHLSRFSDSALQFALVLDLII